mmetsp:Transcript_46800/g.85672  ORF Transcript_46800/g.85672 Transcript_46800/m.85672 type:complete len:442 (-) Transcript_46800:139-1464(-)
MPPKKGQAPAKNAKKAPREVGPVSPTPPPPELAPSSNGSCVYAVGELLKYNAMAGPHVPGVSVEEKPSMELGQEKASDGKNKRRGKQDKKKPSGRGQEGGSEPRAIALSKEIATSSSPLSNWGADQQAQRAAAEALQAYVGMQAMAYGAYASAAAAAAYSAVSQPGGAAGGPTHTTVMLRNIPNRYTRDMLVNRLNEKFEYEYDFVYLPIDFNSKCNVGYAFINFRSPQACQLFTQEFHNVRTKHCLPGFSSQKICEVSPARVQGRDANMENLRDEKFIEKLVERPEWQPLFFNDDGIQVPFASLVGGNDGKGRRTSGRGNKTGGQAASSNAAAPLSSPAFNPMLAGFPYGGCYGAGCPGYPFPPYTPGYPPLNPGLPPLGATDPAQLAAQASYYAKAARQAASAQSPSYLDPLFGGASPTGGWEEAGGASWPLGLDSLVR